MTGRRRLSREDARLWAALAKTVKPLDPPRNGEGDHAQHGGGGVPQGPPSRGRVKPIAPSTAFGGPPPRAGEDRKRPLDSHGLDAAWERKLAKALISPDFTLDLHGHSLEAAHRRLDMGLGQALALGARVVLLITGRPRPAEAADRGNARGAIRAKVMDWLALGPHASKIAAVRPAHRRHGGAGALYVVLRRLRP